VPESDPKRLLARRLFDAVISQVPLVGGPYAALLSVTHPSQLEQLQTAWQSNITEAVNQMESIVSQLLPSITISNEASAIALWISKTSKLGREDPVAFSDLCGALPHFTKLSLEDACGELEYDGLATLSAAIGHKIVRVRPTHLLFEVFDPAVFEDANPRLDAARIARFILTKDDTVGAEEIMKHFGWSVRRYNPAMGIVSSMIDEGRKSAEIHPTIDCRFVMPNSRERAALRHFSNEVLGSVS